MIYAQRGILMSATLDLQRLALTGRAVPVVEGVRQSTTTGDVQYSFSATGSLCYVPGAVHSAQLKLVWVTRNGAEHPAAAPARGYVFPRLSPDGRRIAVGIMDQETQVWLYDLSRETLTRFTFERNVNLSALWTSDGRRITFQSDHEGPPTVHRHRPDRSDGLDSSPTTHYTISP